MEIPGSSNALHGHVDLIKTSRTCLKLVDKCDKKCIFLQDNRPEFYMHVLFQSKTVLVHYIASDFYSLPWAIITPVKIYFKLNPIATDIVVIQL